MAFKIFFRRTALLVAAAIVLAAAAATAPELILVKIADLPSGQFSFQHRRVEKNTPYDYVVVSVDGESREGDPAYLTIR